MPDHDLSFDSANSCPTKDVTPSLTSGSASTNPTQDSERSSDVNSVHPKQAVKHLGYVKPKDEEGLKSYVFAPGLASGLKFEYHYYKAQSEYTELPQVDFWQLRLCVKKIREDYTVRGLNQTIIRACDDFLKMYKEPDDLPSEEVYRGLSCYNNVDSL
jgi:hypothetical protein